MAPVSAPAKADRVKKKKKKGRNKYRRVAITLKPIMKAVKNFFILLQ